VKIAVAADHAGWADKEWLVGHLRAAGHDVRDFGTHSDAACDYPDFAARAAAAVGRAECDQGVLVCGTGIGMSMAANKIHGVRAAACQSAEAARYSRQHNDANVLCLGARLSSREAMQEILTVWLATTFEGGRHARRVGKINALDEGRSV